MFSYVVRRLSQLVIALFAITVISFIIVRAAPGNPFTEGLDPKADPTTTEIKFEQYNLDRPLYYQYVSFYADMFSDLGTLASEGLGSRSYRLESLKTGEPVVPTMVRKVFVTLPLVLITTIIIWTLSFPIGIFSALRRGSAADQTITVLSYALLSIPGFWLALVVVNFISRDIGIPIVGPTTLGSELEGVSAFMDRTWHVAVPAVIGSFGGIAVMTRYVKGQMLEVMDADFVRTARAKGLDPTSVNYKHALRNAALPFIIMIGGILPNLVSGSIVFESIYAWPGLGRWSYNAVLQRDYSIVMTTLFVTSGLTLAGILVSDLLLGFADPRIRLS